MEHSFDIDIAKEYGIPAAILLKHIFYWVSKNKANDKHYIEGRYWTYCSVKAFEELFPYMSAKVIRSALSKLEDGGLIKTGCFNTQLYDRTKWYSITQKGICLCLKSKKALDEEKKPFAEKGEPIPYSYQIDNKYNKSSKEDYICPSSSDTDEKPKTVYPNVVELWNSLASCGIRPIRSITAESKRHVYLRARFKEYGEESFAEAVEKIRESDFLQGRSYTKKPFIITFDWLILPNNYPKVIEGNYKNRNDTPTMTAQQNKSNGRQG